MDNLALKSTTRLGELTLKYLSRTQFPGKFRAYSTLRKMGLLSGSISHEVGLDTLCVPADEWDYWRIAGPENYAIHRLTRLANIINSSEIEFTLLDLGADVGTVSFQIKRLCPKIKRIVAVEPNPKSFVYLQKNLKSLRLPTEAHNVAVSNYNGFSRLHFNSKSNSDHSGHLSDTGHEKVRVVRLDSIYSQSGENVLLKIDVEGEERGTLEGAALTIANSPSVFIFIEIHPSVVARTHISPEDIFETAEKIRPFNWRVADHGLPPIDRSKTFFQQLTDDRQYDIIGVSNR